MNQFNTRKGFQASEKVMIDSNQAVHRKTVNMKLSHPQKCSVHGIFPEAAAIALGRFPFSSTRSKSRFFIP
jgi:hypothetical protein